MTQTLKPTPRLAEFWNEEFRAVLSSNGRAYTCHFFAGAEHVSAWLALGYDVRAAAVRAEGFLALPDAPDKYVEHEKALALAAGVPKDDPFLWRIERFPRHMMYGPFVG